MPENDNQTDFAMERRLDWIKRASRYRDGSRKASQKCEDLVARRVLAGIGISEKGLPRLEKALGLEVDNTRPIIDRVIDAVQCLSNGMVSRGFSGRFGAMCRESGTGHEAVTKDPDALVEAASAFRDGLLVLVRVGDTRNAWCYVVVPDGEYPPWVLQPPSVLLLKHGGYAVWYRDVTNIFHDMSTICGWVMPPM